MVAPCRALPLSFQPEPGTSPLHVADTVLGFSLVGDELIRRQSLKMGQEEGRKCPWVVLFPTVSFECTEARVSVPQVLLCASNQNSSIVECWSLRKEGLPVNNIFQQISPVGEFQHLVLLKVGAWSERKSKAGSQTHYHVYGIIQSPVFIFQVFLVMFC